MKVLKTLLSIVLLACIAGLAYLIVDSVQQPVRFNHEKEKREAVAVQNLKDIRTLQVAFKGETNRYCSTLDSLKDFYENGEMSVIMKIGSMDDSLAAQHTAEVKKAKKGITDAQLYELYKAGDKNLVFSITEKIKVKESLFTDRDDFNVNNLKYIPYSDGALVEMTAITKTVSGVQVPLFEAKMPYKLLLKGLDNQLRINLDDQRKQQNKYVGLQVGSIEAPNNNAGNWE